MVYERLTALHHALFAPACRLCRGAARRGLELCTACLGDLPWLRRACRRCALPLPENSAATVCAHCQTSAGHLDGCRALFRYAAPVDTWVQDLKFRQDLSAGRLLGSLLAAFLAGDGAGECATLLPVPLHRRRLAERGYNQAMEIARPLRRRGWAIDTRCCARMRHTAAQSGLAQAQRAQNMKGAFQTAWRLDGGRFILIDDVLTTGATLNELARVLKRAGAESVHAWAVARAV